MVEANLDAFFTLSDDTSLQVKAGDSMSAVRNLSVWHRLDECPEVLASLREVLRDGLYAEPEWGTPHFFIDIDRIPLPEGANPDWRASYVSSAYRRLVVKAMPDLEPADYILVSSKSYGDVLVVPEEHLIEL